MRVLTVQQPWAWAIFHGKTVENRTQAWSYRGPLAIHAGARMSERGLESPLVQAAAHAANPDLPVVYPFGGTVWQHEPSLHTSAIIGTVDLVDVHEAVPEGPPLPDTNAACCGSPWAEQSYVEHGGRTRTRIVHLVLANPVEFTVPIEGVKGRLGLWVPDPDLADAIAAQDAKPRHPAH